MSFKVIGVDHIGIACADLEEGSKFWGEAMGIASSGKETVAEQKVTTVFHPMWNGAQIELLVATDPTSPIAKFMEKQGGRGSISTLLFVLITSKLQLLIFRQRALR